MWGRGFWQNTLRRRAAGLNNILSRKTFLHTFILDGMQEGSASL